MWDFAKFEKYIKKLLGHTETDIFPVDVREALREYFKRIIDVEVVKNRYGPFAAGKLGFLRWNPEVGIVERPLSLTEVLADITEILAGGGIQEKGKEGKEPKRKRRTTPPAMLGDFPDLPSFTPSAMDDVEEDDELDMPF